MGKSHFAQAQKNKYKTEIDSLVKATKNIQFRNPDSAILLYGSLANYYKLSGNLEGHYVAQSDMANCYMISHRLNESLDIYLDCASYFNKQNDSPHIYKVYTGIAGVYFDLGDFDNVARHLKMASDHCNAQKFPTLKFISLVNIGSCYVSLKKYDSAFYSYRQAEALGPALNNPHFDYQLKVEIANLYYLSGEYDKAINNSLEALRLNKNFDVRLAMTAYHILGVSYLAKRVFDKSAVYMDSALTMSKGMSSQRDTYEYLLNLIQLDTMTGDFKKASRDYFAALTLKDSLFEINKTKLTQELLVKYETEKKEYENKLLENENAKRSSIIKWQRVLIFFVALLSIAIIGILFFYLRYRNCQQKKAIEKDKIQAELKALKAQLNPHFIQNIFQIITNQVNTNPAEVAGFLQKTSNYFRSVLNGTDKNVQSLEDEIIFTEKYLQFQQSLFVGKLSYSLDIADDVDTYGIMVPAMLLQPFIENSIKYGLQVSQQPMHIELTFTKNQNFLLISITDNGHFLVNDTVVNDKSFGNALIEKRLNLFYKDAAIKPTVKSKPLEGNNGFKVNISLPV